MKELQVRDIILRRLAANGLSAPFASALDCVRALAGIQSQFQQWAEVSIMNRCDRAFTMQTMAELYTNCEIINLWGQRHTLHLYAQEDWDAISDVYEPIVSQRNFAYMRRPEAYAALTAKIQTHCRAKGSITRKEIVGMMEEHMQDCPPEKEYFDYLLIMLCCTRGIFFGLPEKPAIKTFIGRERLAGEPWTVNAERAKHSLQDLVRRYFRHYGPATLADFSHWAGLAQSAVKRCLPALETELSVYTCGNKTYYACGQAEQEPDGTGVYLLGKFDPLFVSYKHKDWIIPECHQKKVWRSAGWVEGVVLDRGKAAGTWRHTLKGSKLSLTISPFGNISTATRKKIGARAERLAAFWQKELGTITFDS